MAELSIRTQIEDVSQRFWPDASTIKSVVSIITHHVQERTEQLVHMWETAVDGKKYPYAWEKWSSIAQHVQERI